MKRYCLECGHPLKKGEDHCSSCSFDNSERHLQELDIHQYKKLCYDKKTKGRERKNRSFSFYVIGAVLLILGLVFLVLSYRYSIRHRVFTPDSAEFVFCVLSLSFSAFFLVYASILLIPILFKERYFVRLLKRRK